jgi:hypothetical protein
MNHEKIKILSQKVGITVISFIVETVIIHTDMPRKTKANSPYSSIKNRISIERNSDHMKTEPFTTALHMRSNTSVTLMKPAKNIDSGYMNYNYTTEKRKQNKALKNNSLKTSATFTGQNFLDSVDGGQNLDYTDPSDLQRLNTHSYPQNKNEVTPTKPGSRAVVIKLSDLKVSYPAKKTKNLFGQYKTHNEKYTSAQHTPEKYKKRGRGNRVPMKDGPFPSRFTSTFMSEQKEGAKMMLDSSDTFNMRNSKIMNSESKHSEYNSRPSSMMHKNKQQRKLWQKKSSCH